MNLIAIKMLVGDRAKYFVHGSSKTVPATQPVVEPFVVPKKSLTGDSTERVDTRVLQGLYSFDPKSLPVYVGQQMDVFIEAAPIRPAAVLSYTQTPG